MAGASQQKPRWVQVTFVPIQSDTLLAKMPGMASKKHGIIDVGFLINYATNGNVFPALVWKDINLHCTHVGENVQEASHVSGEGFTLTCR